jgi:hypothetical protein
MDKVKPAGLPARLDNCVVIQTAPQSNPADSEVLNSTTNGIQERGNRFVALLRGAGVNRMRCGGGIVSEAKALGKAEGYADGDTSTWKIEEPVGVKMS